MSQLVERVAEQSSARGQPFTISGTMLIISATDSTDTVSPLEELEENTRGETRWYRLEERGSKTSKHWRAVLGDTLCHRFLRLKGKVIHASRFHPYAHSTSCSGSHRFTLRDFPPGYYLYTHHVGTGSVYDDVRKDTYLVGGGYKFRSPEEALCHFAWLMRNKPAGRCRCIYDDKTWKRKQGPLNKAMNAEWAALLNKERRERFDAIQKTGYYEPRAVAGYDFNDESFLRPVQG